MRGSRRTHLVLIPGFVGFDVLGQIGYYAGVTQRFAQWKDARAERGDVELHYFDSFPTASVGLRAERLRVFLAKLLARGQVEAGDRIALVGHSTGGLDIRRTLTVLAADPGGTTAVDGGAAVSHAALLRGIGHLVFISVPHFGTNLAEFAHRYRATIQATIRNAAIGVLLNRKPIDAFRRALVELFPSTDSDLLLAIRDALDESDEREGRTAPGAQGEWQRASEREARAQLTLWLEHMGKDFHALEDLRCTREPNGAAISPAHHGPDEREAELAAFRGLKMQSYATIVREPALPRWTVSAIKAVAPAVNLPCSALNYVAHHWLWQPAATASIATRIGLQVPALSGGLASIHGRPSLPFRLLHTLCADPRGPFERPPQLAAEITDLVTGARVPTAALSEADNDGIVNTLSMLWPAEVDAAHRIYLVEADHADIVGHYARKQCRAEARRLARSRLHYAYDIFESGSGFGDATFERVWEHIFDFCLS
jgi:hypothetical protein